MFLLARTETSDTKNRHFNNSTYAGMCIQLYLLKAPSINPSWQDAVSSYQLAPSQRLLLSYTFPPAN